MNAWHKSLPARLLVIGVMIAAILPFVAAVNAQFLGPSPDDEEPQITLLSDAQVYAGPDIRTNLLGRFPSGSIVPVDGRTPDSSWWRIEYPGEPNGKGWLSGTEADPNDAAYDVVVVGITFVTATPVLTPIPLPCQFSSSYVADVTIPDGTQIGAAQGFDKVWRMLNSETCPWVAGSQLVFQEGEQMSAPNSVSVLIVAPGETVDISVKMSAPSAAGRYRGIWQMRNHLGEWFGDRITVIIQVPDTAPAPTPGPPPPPIPPLPQPGPEIIEFWASPTRINGDQCTTLTWSVDNVQAVYLEYGGDIYGVSGDSSREVCPSRDGKKFTLRVIMHDGSVEVRDINIHVDNPESVKMDMWADEDEIEIGQCTHVRWGTENAERVEFFNGDDWKGVNRSDYRQVCPTERTEYKIKVFDLYGGEHKRDVTVKVH